ncbi:1934_t:CDS:1, partial [Cetraspora pellucida]
PFTYFWQNLIKIKYKFIEVELLKEEVDEEKVKKARKVKAPLFQLPKNAGKIDIPEFEKEYTLKFNTQYYEAIKVHTE